MHEFNTENEQYLSKLVDQVLVTQYQEKGLEIATDPASNEGFYAQLDQVNDSDDVLGYVLINSTEWDSSSAVDILVDTLLGKSDPVVKKAHSLGYFHEVLSSRFRHSLGRLLTKALQLEKPSVACMNGEITSEYLGLTLAFDARIATPDTYFNFNHLQTGLPVSPGCTLLMPRYIGIGKTMSLIQSSARLDAEEALSLGLISEIVEDQSQLLERSVQFVNEVTRTNPQVIKYCKKHMLPSLSELNEALDNYYSAMTKSVIMMRNRQS